MTHTFTHNEIREHIEVGALMTLGAHKIRHWDHDGKSVVEFIARILPIRKDGQRGTRPRNMRVQIYQDPVFPEELALCVGYYTANRYTSHLLKRRIEPKNLSSFLMALDCDGDDVLNPRILKAMVGSRNRCHWYPECGGEATAIRQDIAVCDTCAESADAQGV